MGAITLFAQDAICTAPIQMEWKAWMSGWKAPTALHGKFS